MAGMVSQLGRYVISVPFKFTFAKQAQDGKEAPLLPPLSPSHKGRKCLVLDLDETLVHSSFKVSMFIRLQISIDSVP